MSEEKNVSLASKLSAVARNKSKNKSSKQHYESIVVYLGAEPVEHFPKLRDASGLVVKDSNGEAEKSKVSDGWVHTFSEVGTSKVVKVVLPKKYNLAVLGAFTVSGNGYDIRSGNMLFLDEATQVLNYK